MFPATVAGSLPKPSWLAEPNKLWPQWRLQGADLAQGKLDATLLAIKLQEDAGIDIVCDGEHVAPAFRPRLSRIRRRHRLRAQGRDGHPRQPLQSHGADGARRAEAERPRASGRGPTCPRAHQPQIKNHAAGADDHCRHDCRRALRRQDQPWPWPLPACSTRKRARWKKTASTSSSSTNRPSTCSPTRSPAGASRRCIAPSTD